LTAANRSFTREVTGSLGFQTITAFICELCRLGYSCAL
jgi:hypothetical protein